MSKKCSELHQVFRILHRFTFPFGERDIPLNGIYVLFEKGEYAHDTDRIVRIGTHVGDNQLPSRLQQHFLRENKDRSIFRKNIGRALLNMRKDNYLNIWELDLTTRESKEKYGHLINKEYQAAVEQGVTKVIQSKFSFVVIAENNKDVRLALESKLISEVSKCDECKASPEWLGRFSTKAKIRDSGLWQVNELYKEGFSDQEINNFFNNLTV